jgi:hypothetical protein
MYLVEIGILYPPDTSELCCYRNTKPGKTEYFSLFLRRAGLFPKKAFLQRRAAGGTEKGGDKLAINGGAPCRTPKKPARLDREPEHLTGRAQA